MEVRLVQLIASSIRVHGEFSLARLEYAMAHPDRPAPPTLRRLPDASEATLRREWEGYERELGEIVAFVKQADGGRGRRLRSDATLETLKRIVRELDQYARALRWVLTVTERDSA